MNLTPPRPATGPSNIPGDKPAQADLSAAAAPAPAPDMVHEKLNDALTPGYRAEFDPAEADRAGAFAENALSEEDALASTEDSVHSPAAR